MKFVNTSVISFFATIIKFSSNLVLNKLVALHGGTGGLALFGQFQSVNYVAMSVGQSLLNSGVIKYTSENDDIESIELVLNSAVAIITTMTVFTVVALMMSSKLLSNILFKDELEPLYINLIACSLLISMFNGIVLSWINGKKYISLHAVLNILHGLFTTLVAIILTKGYGIEGAIVSVIVSHIIMLLIQFSFYKYISELFLYKINIFPFLWGGYVKKLSSFAFVSFLSVSLMHLSSIIIRSSISDSLGWQYAGYWHSLNQLSNTYLNIASMTLGVYLLPMLSSLDTGIRVKKELLRCMMVVVPALLIALVVIFALRGVIIKFLYSADFMYVRSFFYIQLVGDFFRIIAWMLGCALVARAKLKEYFYLQVLLYFLLTLVSIAASRKVGFPAVIWAYSITQLLYFVLLFVTCNKKL